MKLRRLVLVICGTVSLLWLGAAREASAYSEDFDSYTNGTPMTAVPNWQAPPGGSGNGQFNVWADSEIDANNTNTPPINYGAAGYAGTQGMESKFASGGSTISQEGAMVTMTGSDVITSGTVAPFFSTQIRPANQYVYQPQQPTDNGIANSYMLYLGTGIQYNNSSSKMFWTNASAFVVYFESAADSGGPNTVWTETPGTATPSYTPGFAANAAGTNDFNYRLNASTTWSRDTWYTVQLSDFAFGSATTNCTAVLNIFASSNPSDILVSNLVISAQGGNSNSWGQSFSQINQIGFAETRQNGVDDIDNITLVPEPSTVVLTLSGLLGAATVMRRRNRKRRRDREE
jgi:hypothetical protein